MNSFQKALKDSAIVCTSPRVFLAINRISFAIKEKEANFFASKVLFPIGIRAVRGTGFTDLPRQTLRPIVLIFRANIAIFRKVRFRLIFFENFAIKRCSLVRY